MRRSTSEISPVYGRIWTVRDDKTNISAWGLTQTEALLAFAMREASLLDRPERPDTSVQLELFGE